MDLDLLDTSDVLWEPYSDAAVAYRAPLGLSSWCTANQAYWLTTTPMVYDHCIEPHCSDRVMRQFGYRQPFPIAFASTFDRVTRHDHRYSARSRASVTALCSRLFVHSPVVMFVNFAGCRGQAKRTTRPGLTRCRTGLTSGMTRPRKTTVPRRRGRRRRSRTGRTWDGTSGGLAVGSLTLTRVLSRTRRQFRTRMPGIGTSRSQGR
jgi:Plant mobile domain